MTRTARRRAAKAASRKRPGKAYSIDELQKRLYSIPNREPKLQRLWLHIYFKALMEMLEAEAKRKYPRNERNQLGFVGKSLDILSENAVTIAYSCPEKQWLPTIARKRKLLKRPRQRKVTADEVLAMYKTVDQQLPKTWRRRRDEGRLAGDLIEKGRISVRLPPSNLRYVVDRLRRLFPLMSPKNMRLVITLGRTEAVETITAHYCGVSPHTVRDYLREHAARFKEITPKPSVYLERPRKEIYREFVFPAAKQLCEPAGYKLGKDKHFFPGAIEEEFYVRVENDLSDRVLAKQHRELNELKDEIQRLKTQPALKPSKVRHRRRASKP